MGNVFSLKVAVTALGVCCIILHSLKIFHNIIVTHLCWPAPCHLSPPSSGADHRLEKRPRTGDTQTS